MQSFIQLLLLVLLVNLAFGEFPSFVKLCKRDNQLNECLKENIETARNYVQNGIPKLFVHPANPFKLPLVSYQSEIIVFNLTEFEAYGLDNFNLKNINLDLDKNKLDIEIEFKKFIAYSNYVMKGRFIGIDLDGRGPIQGNISDINYAISFNGKRLEKDGKTYLDFSEKSIKMKHGEASVHYKNLFPNEELNEAVNKIINNHAAEAIKEVQPIFTESFPLILTESVVKVFQKFSIQELFPL